MCKTKDKKKEATLVTPFIENKENQQIFAPY
jgi:hypothetical protein